MPGIRAELIGTGNTDELVRLASHELSARRARFDELWAYYEGQQRKYLKVREGEPDYNVIVNLCARVIDQSVNLLLGEAPQFDLEGNDQSTAQDELNGWMDTADLEEFLIDLFTMAGVTGHAFVKLQPGEDGLTRPVALDAGLVSVFWDARDKSEVLGYMILWSEGGKETYREDHWRAENGQSWEVVFYEGNGRDWIEQSRETWPYPFAQIVDWKNLPNPRGFYGRSDIEKVIGLNDAYNFRVSNTNKILYIHAHPRTIGFGVRKSDVQATSIDGFWDIPDKDAKMQNLEMTSDLESSRRHAEEMKSDFFGDAQTMDLSTVKDKAGALTNFGLRLLFTEALAKNAKKRMAAGRGLSEMVRRSGTMMGKDWTGVTTVWADPLPENRTEQIANAKETIDMGVASKQTESEHLGYDWGREKAQMEEEQGASQARLGASLANALRGFDQGNAQSAIGDPLSPSGAQGASAPKGSGSDQVGKPDNPKKGGASK